MNIDHHIHTYLYSPDSMIDPDDLWEQARRVGLDGVVITEHDYQWETDELAELAERAAPLRVFTGAEISAREGHFLVYGLPSLKDVPPGVSLAELLAVVRRQEAAIVAAHPFRWDQPFDEIVAEHGPVFDALELASNNVSVFTRSRTEALLRQFPMGSTASSDAHDLDVVGCYFTELPAPIDTIADFVAAIRSGQGRPRNRRGAYLACGPVG
jgi:predicted metal-dependent phosphoesterase TrpH